MILGALISLLGDYLSGSTAAAGATGAAATDAATGAAADSALASAATEGAADAAAGEALTTGVTEAAKDAAGEGARGLLSTTYGNVLDNIAKTYNTTTTLPESWSQVPDYLLSNTKNAYNLKHNPVGYLSAGSSGDSKTSAPTDDDLDTGTKNTNGSSRVKPSFKQLVNVPASDGIKLISVTPGTQAKDFYKEAASIDMNSGLFK